MVWTLIEEAEETDEGKEVEEKRDPETLRTSQVSGS